ncbi:MAG: CHASE3 domain-containing protein, partial [Sneathiella sp.]|nr:CHASE3 domain-containing protein [Sneathiella sp.]
MRFQDLKTKTKILIGIGSPMVLFVLLGAVLANSIGSIVETDRAVDHTHKVLAKASDISRSAVDMQTGMRGYLLAGKEAFLGPYELGEKKTYARIDELRSIVTDNPTQTRRLDQIRGLLKEWQKQVAEPTIALRREIGDGKTMNDLARLVAEVKGKQYFDKFRRQINSFVQQEEELLRIHHKEFSDARQSVDHNSETVDQSEARVNQALQVLAATAELKADAVDIETGMRGFLLTGDEDYLEPYTIGKQKFTDTVARLSHLIRDNQVQVDRLEKLRSTVEDWIENITGPAIQQRREDDTNTNILGSISKRKLTKTGKQYLDSFRVQLAVFNEAELTLMNYRQTTAATAKNIVEDSLIVMSENEVWVSHTIQVIQNANAILTTGVDMQTGMRGYLLAGKQEFLEPYTTGTTKFYSDIANLRNTVSDNPEQVQLLVSAGETIRTWQETVIEPIIALRREIGHAKTMDDMAHLIGESRGKKFFDDFRILMNAFEAEEY